MSHPNPSADFENLRAEDEDCDHTDTCMDEFVCLTCGLDRREELMSRAYDRAKDRRKYGD